MVHPIRLYSERTHYSREQRAQLADILRPYWKDAPISDEQRGKMYGLSAEDFCLVDKPVQADIAVLPMTWNHYLNRGELQRAVAFIHAAQRVGRPVLSYVSGDEGVTVPLGFGDVYVIRASGRRSRSTNRQLSQPVFFDDPLKHYPEMAEGEGQRSVVSSQWPVVNCVPSIGFCGQASVNALKLIADVLRACLRNLSYYAGWRLHQPQPFYPTSLLRARAMRVLARSPLVVTRFIARSQYRAGANDTDTLERTATEFYANIASTDYTLCVRGGGNFSKRFYETLAVGRIPVLVDTDCLLPFESVLKWGDYIVRVPAGELANLPKAVAGHFSAHGSSGLAELKRRCRKLWEAKLAFGAFHRHLVRHILGFEKRASAPVSRLPSAVFELLPKMADRRWEREHDERLMWRSEFC